MWAITKYWLYVSDEMKKNKKMKEEKLLELQFWNDRWDILNGTRRLKMSSFSKCISILKLTQLSQNIGYVY